MSTYLKYQFETIGDPYKVIKSEKINKPVIAGESEVIVKIKAAAINPADLMFVEGNYGIKPKLPSGVGGEGSGVIEAVGSGVKDLKVGQLVHFVGIATSWGEYALFDQKTANIIPVPDGVSVEEASQITVNPLTALAMLEELGVKEGETILQTGSSSALGRILIQFAKLRGVKTINIVRRDEQIEQLKSIGGDYVINSEKENVPERVKQITNGEGVKYALDSIGGKLAPVILNSLSKNGIYLAYGVLGGSEAPIDFNHLIFGDVTVKGFWITLWIPKNLPKVKELYGEIFKYLVTKKLNMPAKTFDGKTQLHEAITHSKQPGKTEKTLLVF